MYFKRKMYFLSGIETDIFMKPRQGYNVDNCENTRLKDRAQIEG